MNVLRMRIAVFLLVLVSPGCNRTEYVPGAVAPEWPDEINVITFNTCVAGSGDNSWLERRKGWRRMIATESPDILCVQEATKYYLDYICGNCGADGKMYGYTGQGRDGGVDGEYTAIMFNTRRLRLLDGGVLWFSETPDVPSLGWDAANRRTVTWAHLVEWHTEREVFVFNAHLDHIGSLSRYESVRLLCEFVGAKCPDNANVIITGDFNEQPYSALFVRIFDEGFSDVRVAAPDSRCEYTFNAFGDRDRYATIDYIFVRGLESVSLRVLDDDYGVPYISDHYPVKAVVGF